MLGLHALPACAGLPACSENAPKTRHPKISRSRIVTPHHGSCHLRGRKIPLIQLRCRERYGAGRCATGRRARPGYVDWRVGQPSPRRGGGERAGAGAGALCRDVRRLHGEALPREAGGAARLPAGLYGDAAGAAGLRAGEEGAAARRAPAQAAAAAAARDAAAPGRGAARLAGGPAAARPRGHARRRDERVYSAILVEEEGTASSFRALAEVVTDMACSARSTPTAAATISTRPAAGGPRRPGASDPGRPGAGRARHRARRRLLAAGARPLRARLPHLGGPAAQRAGAGRDHRHRRRQRLAARGLPAGAQRPLRGGRPRRQAAPSCRPRRDQWREVLCLRETRQVGNDNCVRWKDRRSADPEEPAAARTSSAPRCGCTSIPTARSRSSGGRTVSPTSRPRRPMPRTARRDPLRRRKRCGQRCRVAHTATTTEADKPCAT